MDVEVEKDDLNQKFLTSLAPEWLMHTIVWRNRNDLDTMSLDDLYNHLKVYEYKVHKKSNSNSHNMAFISSSKNSSGNEDGLLKASKNLDHLIESQRYDQVEEGVGYNAVPPPAADLYLSPKKDLSWTGLPEFVNDTVTDYSKLTPNVASTSAEGQNKDSSTSEDVASPKPPKPFVKFAKGTKRDPHGAPMRPSHKSIGHRPHGASMKPSNRPADHKSHGPSMNLRRPTSFFNQAPSYETRPFLKSSVVKTPYRAPWVPTVNRNNPPVNRKFSTGRRNFPTVNRKFPLLAEKLPLVAQKITLLIWEGREKL
nr:ribonuclease H-like domain-containing protein [Tanacetum cinerariifolium]